jgi:hypothetical protein
MNLNQAKDTPVPATPGQQLPGWTSDIEHTPLAAELRSDSLLGSAKSIFIASDYGGEHQSAKHKVYSFLVVDFNRQGLCISQQKQTREKYFGGKSYTIEFKKLAASGRDSALPDWLRSADNLIGYLITLAVDVKLDSIFGQPDQIGQLPQILSGTGLGNSWKPHIAEKLLRILHFQSYLCSLVLRPQQGVFWMTDRDAITEDSEKTKALLNTWVRVFPLYIPDGLAKHKLGLAIPFDAKNPEGRQLNDALTYPDLAAGAVEEFLADYFSEGPKNRGKTTTDSILKWLAVDSPTLKKRVLRIAPFKHPDGQVGFQTSYLKKKVL